MDDLLKRLLKQMRPSASGQNRGLSSRFRTSDVLQESAIQIIGEIDKQGEEDFAPPKAWLKRVARGHASNLRDYHRAQKRTANAETSVESHLHRSPDPSPDEIAAKKELSRQVILCLAQLDEDSRTIIDCYFTKQMSFAKIGAEMGKPQHWVRRQYRRAIETLESLMKSPD